jgi:Spy/CpxP family protein refolding chaperone
MFGFLIGAACLIGLVKVVRHGRGWGSGGCGRHGGPGGFVGGGRWGRGFRPRWMFRRIFEQLETTPGQEKVIFEAFDDVRETAAKFRDEVKQARADVASALRGENFDQAKVREAFTRHDTLIEELRKSVLAGLAKIHEALDERQRGELASTLESFGHYGRWGRGAYGTL